MGSNPRVGSRPFALASMEVGDRLLFEAKAGQGSRLMQQIRVDASRYGVPIQQALAVAVQVSSREVFDVVIVTRIQSDTELTQCPELKVSGYSGNSGK